MKIALPEGTSFPGDTESIWVEPTPTGGYEVKNVPFFAKGFSYGDLVEGYEEKGTLKFRRVLEHRGHSTYRVVASEDRHNPEMEELFKKLKDEHCDVEPATDKLVAVDVLPEADIYKVYALLEEAESENLIDFQEGHCGHRLRTT